MTAWLHGLRVESAIDLPCMVAPPGAVDLAIKPTIEKVGVARNDRSGEPGLLPADRQLLFRDHQLEIWEDRSGATRWAIYPRFGLTFGLAHHEGHTTISVMTDDAGDWIAWMPVLAQGAVVTASISLAGRAAFHANTIDIGGQGVLIGGVSGAGKTVASALLVLAGHALVADDVTVVDPGRPVRPGLLELRIRTHQNPVGQLLVERLGAVAGTRVRDTVDSRVAVRMAIDPPVDGVPVTQMLLPMTDRTVTRPRVTPLSGVQAVTALLPAMRLVGWTDPQRHRADFSHCADLAERVNVCQLALPSLSVDDPEGVRRLAEQLDRLVQSL